MLICQFVRVQNAVYLCHCAKRRCLPQCVWAAWLLHLLDVCFLQSQLCDTQAEHAAWHDVRVAASCDVEMGQGVLCRECIDLMKELEAPVKHIVLTTHAYEHKVFIAPFQRRFPDATVYVPPK